MAKIEKEIKVLDIDVKSLTSQLLNMGAQDKGTKIQKIYVYDIPTLYYRFLEIKELLNSKNKVLIDTNKKRLSILLSEYQDLLAKQELENILNHYKLSNLSDITQMSLTKIREFLNNPSIITSFKKFKINPNKWIRLRESNDTTTLTCKHIVTSPSFFQNTKEIEFQVSSFTETNLFLESIGLARRSYQEKIRHSFIYKTAEIEIDIWPFLKPYMEIECDDNNIIKEIITKLSLNNHKIVSLNTEQLYKEIGIDIHSLSELKFPEEINY